MNFLHTFVHVAQMLQVVTYGVVLCRAIGNAATIFKEIKSHWGDVKKFTTKIVNWVKKVLPR